MEYPEKFKKIKLDLSKIFIILTIISITFLISFGYLNKGLPTGTDILIWVSWLNSLKINNWWFTTWYPTRSFGQSTLFYNPHLNIIFYLFSLIFEPIDIIKFYIIILIAFSGISSYIFIQKYIKNRYVAIIGIIIYMMHQLFLSQIIEGHPYLIFGYALFPLIFFFYSNIIDDNDITKNKYFIAFPFLILIYLINSQPYFIFMLFFYLVVYTFLHFGYDVFINKELDKAKLFFKNSLILTITSIGTGSILIIPYLFGVKQTLTPPGREFVTKIVDSVNFFQALMGQSSEISFLKFGYNVTFWNNPNFYYLLLIIPVLSFTAFIIKRNKPTILFTVLAFISIFLSKGIYPPLGEAYEILYSIIPFFSNIWVADRWNIMQALCYSLLSSITVNEIISKISSLKLRREKILKLTIFSFFFVLVLGSNILFSYNAINYGAKSFSFPENYLLPYYKLKELEGDFNIFPVPYGQLYTRNSPPGGLSRAPSYYSPFIHDKGILTGEGGTKESRIYLGFINNLMKSGKTNSLMKLLGPLNVKYAVLQANPEVKRVRYTENSQNYPSDEYNFILNQEGSNMVYNDSYNNIIIDNEYYSPIIHTTDQKISVFGGLRTLLKISSLSNLDITKKTINLISRENFPNGTINSDQLCSSDFDLNDIVFLSNELDVMDLSDIIEKKSKDPNQDWIKSQVHIQSGFFQFSDYSIATKSDKTLTFDVQTSKSGNYSLFIRLFYAQDRGRLSVTIDDFPVLQNLKPTSSFHNRGYKWVELGPLFFEKGKHTVTIKNDASGNTDIDCVSLVSTDKFEEIKKQVLEWLEIQSNILQIWEAEELFDIDNNGDRWTISDLPYILSDGYAITYGTDELSQDGIFLEQNIKFKDRSGSWSVLDETIYNSGNGGETLNFGENEWSDYILNLDVKVDNGSDVGIDFRWDGINRYYRIQQLDSEYGSIIQLVKGSDLGDMGIWSTHLEDYDPTVWHTWRLSVKENNIQLDIDGNNILNYTDPSEYYDAGKLRLRTFNTKAEFKISEIILSLGHSSKFNFILNPAFVLKVLNLNFPAS
jgi:hypothetical protein